MDNQKKETLGTSVLVNAAKLEEVKKMLSSNDPNSLTDSPPFKGTELQRGNHLPDIYTMEELENAKEPEYDWFADKLFARSHTVLISGREKSGKSYTGLALTCNLSVGEPFLGYFPTKKSHVWYMALEDSEWRIKKRLKRELRLNYDRTKITFAQRLRAGAEALRIIRSELERRKVDVLIIDTAARVDDPNRAQNYLAESVWYENFQEMAIDYNICIILITHMTKSGVGDASNQFITTRGQGGNTSIVDTIIQIRTEFGSSEAEMVVTGRDVQSQAFLLRNIQKEPNTGILWNIVREIESDMIGLSGSIKEVLLAIDDAPLSVEDICQKTGLQEKNVYKILNTLQKEGRIMKIPIEGQGNKRMYSPTRNS